MYVVYGKIKILEVWSSQKTLKLSRIFFIGICPDRVYNYLEPEIYDQIETVFLQNGSPLKI